MKLQTTRKNETSTDQSKMLPRLRDGAKTFRDPRFSNYLSPCSHLVVKVDRKTYCEAVTSQSKKDENITVADPDLQIKGGPGFPCPEIRGEAGLQIFFRPLRPQFGLKIRGPGPPGPSPTSATELGSQFLTPRNISVSAKDVCILPYNGNGVVLSIAATVKLIGPPAVQWSTPAQQPVRIAPNHRLQKLAQITDIAITDG